MTQWYSLAVIINQGDKAPRARTSLQNIKQKQMYKCFRIAVIVKSSKTIVLMVFKEIKTFLKIEHSKRTPYQI